MGMLDRLKRYFGYTSFKNGQADVIASIDQGFDTVAVMPTGGGKSICYQLPALEKAGITIVISPLISLMHDQVIALKHVGISSAYINSSLTSAQVNEVYERARNGMYKIIYIAPERLLSMQFIAFANEVKIAMVTVDEAHCISQWGQQFRPSYLDIPQFISKLSYRPIISAFTATATPKVKKDIIELLQLHNPKTYATTFDRPNLFFEVKHVKDKKDELLSFINANKDVSGIVYCTSRKDVEEITEFLNDAKLSATRYHAGLSREERNGNQEDFINDKKAIMVATNAFGMGIDKSNVNFVVHFNMPKDLESYYQEAGRAGRDGTKSKCLLLFSNKDVATIAWMISNNKDSIGELSYEEIARVKNKELERLNIMVAYSNSNECLRAYILNYFGESTPDKCGNCANCNSNMQVEDITAVANKIFSCIDELMRSLGISIICDILRGSKNQRVLSMGLDNLKSYNTCTESSSALSAIIIQLIIKGFLYQEGLDYPVLKLTNKGKEAMMNNEIIEIKMPVQQKKSAKSSSKQLKSSSGIELVEVQDKMLFDVLKDVRMRLAETQKVPAYIIFDNKTLINMALEKPRDEAQLLNISGVGEFKLNKYGDQFLTAINEYINKQN